MPASVVDKYQSAPVVTPTAVILPTLPVVTEAAVIANALSVSSFVKAILPLEIKTSPLSIMKAFASAEPVIVRDTVAVVAVVRVIAPVEVPQIVTPPVPLPSTCNVASVAESAIETHVKAPAFDTDHVELVPSISLPAPLCAKLSNAPATAAVPVIETTSFVA